MVRSDPVLNDTLELQMVKQSLFHVQNMGGGA